jgi:predicted MFS family arabinose efflux permease
MSGFVGAVITGFVLEWSKAYRTVLKVAYTLAVLAWVLFLSSATENNYTMFLTSGSLLGLFLLPVIPSTIVNTVECVYPLSGDQAVGLLYSAANLLAVPMTFVGQILLAESTDAPAPFYHYGVWAMITMGVGLISVLMYQGTYKRMEVDVGSPVAEPLVGGYKVTEI